jgi:prepilin-type N-terminal cleavage/methylation domain-containing protein
MRQRLLKSQSGLTMVEMLVAITVLGLLSGAIAAVMIAQIKSSVSQQGQATVQSDVNLAMTTMRWDLAQTGLGQPSYENTVIQTMTQAVQGDSIVLTGAVPGTTTDQGRWTVVLNSSNLQPEELLVRKWTGSDSVLNPRINDTLIAMSPLKQAIGNVVVKGITYTGASVPDPSKQMLLTLDTATAQTMLAGAMLTQREAVGGAQSGQAVYSFDPANRRLLRNGLPLLDNVEQYQVRIFRDRDGDGEIDTTAEFDDVFNTTVDPRVWNTTPIMVGVTLVTSPPVSENRQVDLRNTVNIWNSNYPLTPAMQRRYRNIHTMLVRPRNIGG